MASEMTTRNDVAWLASCYVAGEFSAEEAAAFEARLANDEAACEAVARAMELNLAIAAVFDSQPATLVLQPSTFNLPPSVPPRRVATTITALAATAVAAAGLALMVGHGSSPQGFARKDGADRLVAAWANGEAARNNADDEDSLEVANDDDLDPPDWMLAALTVEDVNEKLPGHDEVREN